MTAEASDDRGVAIVWALALVSLLLLVGLACAGVAAQAVARQRAATVADLAALAAVQAIVDPCAKAASTAAANGMSLTACAQEGTDVVIEVSSAAPETTVRLLALLGRPAADVRSSARAGEPSP